MTGRRRHERGLRRQTVAAGALAAAIVLALSACGGDDGGGSADGSGSPSVATGGWAAIEAAAIKEGEVNWISSDNVTTDGPIIEAFNKKYPGIKVNNVQAGTEIAARVSSELQSGIYQQDVITTGFKGLVETPGWFMELTPSVMPFLDEADWFDNMTADTWVAKHNQFLGVSWNTNLVEGDGPTKWSDLLDPKFKGKIVLSDPRATETNTSWLDAVQQSLGDDFLVKLRAQEPLVEAKGAEVAVQAVGAGAYAVSFPQPSRLTAELASKGAPVKFRVLTDPLVGVPGHMAVFAKAPHPNAALVLANFRAGPEAAAVVCRVGGSGDTNGFSAPYSSPSVPGCYVPPPGKEIVLGDKSLSASDDRYVQLLALIGLKPKTS